VRLRVLFFIPKSFLKGLVKIPAALLVVDPTKVTASPAILLPTLIAFRPGLPTIGTYPTTLPTPRPTSLTPLDPTPDANLIILRLPRFLDFLPALLVLGIIIYN
jgi:hypothetical protein